MRRNDLTSFDWDKGNIDKNSQKHGVSPNEAEEVFLDENSIVFDDELHSFGEKRLKIIGKTVEETMLLVAFTMRSKKFELFQLDWQTKRKEIL